MNGFFAPVIRAALPLQAIGGGLRTTALLEAFGGQASIAGVRVTPETALSLSAVWRAVTLIAGTMGSLPLPVYERTADGKALAPDHPLYQLLHDEPNPWMTAFKWRETLEGHRLLQGNGFCEIERDVRGTPVAFWPLRPDRMDRPLVSEARTLLYPYRLPDGEPVLLPQRNVFHLRGFSPDGIWGYTPITIHREGLGLALATREYGARWFSQGARPGGVLQSAGRVTEDARERMAKSWRVAHEGLSMAHRVAILEEGVTWQSIGANADDAQYLASRNFDIQEIGRMFGVAPYKLYEESRSTFNNIEVQSQEFEQDSVRMRVVDWEQQITHDLFVPAERGRYFAEFNMNALLRADAAGRAALYANGRTWTWLNPNEIRQFENLNRVDGLDDYSMPANMIPIGTDGKPQNGVPGMGPTGGAPA